MSQLRVANIADTSGVTRANTSKISTSGFYTRNVVTQVDTTSRTATGWTLGPEFAALSMQGGSLIKMTYHVPLRNDAGANWGGAYVEPQIRFNGGSYQSLGSSGYDGPMANTGDIIVSYHQSLLIDPGISTDFTAQIRFYFKAYDGTVSWNLSHDINAVSGTATIMSGNNGNQHYMHVIVEELARFV